MRCAGLVAGLIAGAVSGCGAAEEASPDEGTRWALVEDLRIGALDSSDPDQFGYVADIHVDDRDRIWVVDGPTQQIRIFDASGAWVRTVGRSGAGPREFGTAGGLDTGPEGNVWVSDGRNVRWAVLDSAAEFLTTHPRAPGTYRFGDRWGPDDLLYTWVALPGGYPPTFVLVRRRLERTRLVPVDTLPVPSADPGKSSAVSFVRDGRRMTMMVPTPFQAVRKRVLLPGSGWWISHPGPRYRLARVDLMGDTVALFEAPFEPVQVTESDLAQAVDRIAATGSMELDAAPSVHAPVEELIALADGRALARRRTSQGWVFDLFETDATRIATIPDPLGLRFEVRTTTEDALYGVVLDDLGVPYVVRLWLERSPRGDVER